MNVARLFEQPDRHRVGDRVTVFWSCGDEVLCTTGCIVFFDDCVLAVKGLVPTAQETVRDHGCHDEGALELLTVIDVEHICAVVFGLPPCRKAELPKCCRPGEHRRTWTPESVRQAE